MKLKSAAWAAHLSRPVTQLHRVVTPSLHIVAGLLRRLATLWPRSIVRQLNPPRLLLKCKKMQGVSELKYERNSESLLLKDREYLI